MRARRGVFQEFPQKAVTRSKKMPPEVSVLGSGGDSERRLVWRGGVGGGAGLDGVDRGRSTISCAVHRTSDMLTTSLTRADASMSTFTIPRIYTCLTDATPQSWGHGWRGVTVNAKGRQGVASLRIYPWCGRVG
jgi:hypothetical protein